MARVPLCLLGRREWELKAVPSVLGMCLSRRMLLPFLLLGLALVAPFAVSSVALAEDPRIGSLVIEKPWARASIGTSRPAAAYLTIRNEGGESDTLLTVRTPLSGKSEVHATTNDNGVMRMGPAGPVEIPAGGEVSLAPGGLHIMMMKLQAPLIKGESIEITLEFQRTGEITVTAPIYGPGATRPE